MSLGHSMRKVYLVNKFKNDVKKRSRLLRTLLAIDQLFNVVLWNGSQDETISSHIGRRIESENANIFEKKLCSFLRYLEKSHCIKSRGE